MERLNHNHLRCFWAVAREGSIAGACRRLGLSQPTISKQVGDLEDELGAALFRRVGRRLVLTDLGRTVLAYADDIFAASQELLEVVRGRASGRPVRLHVGVSDVVPKLLSRLVIEPALGIGSPVRLVCREGKAEQLIAELALGGLDVVITDVPPPAGSRFRVHCHDLGDSDVGVYGAPALAARHRRRFPSSLEGAPMLLPTESTALRRSIDAWLGRLGVRPEVVGEFDDSALIKSFAEAGHGMFLAPTALERHIRERYGVRLVGLAEGVREGVHAITAERRVTHPGVAAMLRSASGLLSG